MVRTKKFTLMELLVVITIITIVITLIVPNAIGYLEKLRIANCTAQVSQIDLAIQNYNNDFNSYFPITLSSTSDYKLSSLEKQSLFEALTGQNPRKYNYLPSIQLDGNQEPKNPWGVNFEILVNVAVDSQGEDKTDIALSLVDNNQLCYDALVQYEVPGVAPLRAGIPSDYIIYTFSGDTCFHSLQ